MRRLVLSLTLPALLMVGATRSEAGGLDLRLGAFVPRGDSLLFDDLESLYTRDPFSECADPDELCPPGIRPRDFAGPFGGIEYNTVVAPNIELAVSLDAYGSGWKDTSYREHVRESGGEIAQRLRLNAYPIGVSVRFMPTDKGARIVPFIGGGVDAIPYRFEETGAFIDFDDPLLTVVEDWTFKDNGAAFGFHAQGGVRVYLNRDFAIVAEGKYLWAKKQMGDDFAGSDYEIDLGGPTLTVGLHVRF